MMETTVPCHLPIRRFKVTGKWLNVGFTKVAFEDSICPQAFHHGKHYDKGDLFSVVNHESDRTSNDYDADTCVSYAYEAFK